MAEWLSGRRPVVRIGVIGTGRIGTMHARNLLNVSGVREVPLFDIAEGVAARAASSVGHGTSVCSHLEEILDRVDGVVIATTTAAHLEVLTHAVEQGVPALCEKPLASNLTTMQEVVELVEDRDATVLVGFQRRFDPSMVSLKQRITDGAVGKLMVVRATGCDAVPPAPEYLPTSGGIFRDLLIHDLDAVPWLIGEPVVEVSAQGSVLVDEMFAEADDVDVATVTLTFASGAIAQLVGTRFNPLGYDHRIEVLGTKDSLVVGLSDPDRTPLAYLDGTQRRAGSAPWPGFPERFAAAYAAEMATFVRVIAGESDNPSPVQDSLISLELAEACEQSRRTHRPVRLHDVHI